jgi:hypothetical protein
LGNFVPNNHWYLYVNTPASVRITNVAASGTRSCMMVDSSSYGYSYLQSQSSAFNPLTSGSVEADLRTEGDGFYFFLASSSGNTMAKVVFESGALWAYSSYTEAFLENVTPDHWYHVRMDFDCNSDQYDVYVDGVQKASNLSFQYTSSTMQSINVGTSSSYSGNRCYVDNISVTQ